MYLYKFCIPPPRQPENYGLMYQRPLKSKWILLQQIYLYLVQFFQFSIMLPKQCWVLWFFLKTVSNAVCFLEYTWIKLLFWVCFILSETFDTGDRTLAGLQLSFSYSIFFKASVDFCCFKSLAMQPLISERFIIFLWY